MRVAARHRLHVRGRSHGRDRPVARGDRRAEADHDVILAEYALLMLPHALASTARRTPAVRPPKAGDRCPPRRLGDIFVGAIHIALMIAHLAAGDVELATEAADTAGLTSAACRGPHRSIARTSPRPPWHAAISLQRGARQTPPSRATSGWFQAAALMVRSAVAIAEEHAERSGAGCPRRSRCSASLGAYQWLPNMLEIVAGLAGGTSSHHEAARLFGAADGIRQTNRRGALSDVSGPVRRIRGQTSQCHGRQRFRSGLGRRRRPVDRRRRSRTRSAVVVSASGRRAAGAR